MSREIFEIMDEKIKQGFTDDLKGSITGENHFRDYVHVALTVDEDQWAEDFINTYADELPEKIRENNLYISLALLNLKRKNYKKAIELANKTKRKHYINDLDFFRILICANFESGNLLECTSAKKRFQEYMIKNSRFPKTYRKSSKNFIGCLTRLIQFKESLNKNILSDLEYEVNDKEELLWRTWLTNMITDARTNGSA